MSKRDEERSLRKRQSSEVQWMVGSEFQGNEGNVCGDERRGAGEWMKR